MKKRNSVKRQIPSIDDKELYEIYMRNHDECKKKIHKQTSLSTQNPLPCGRGPVKLLSEVLRSFYLAGAKATGANGNRLVSAVDIRAYLSEIGLPSSACLAV